MIRGLELPGFFAKVVPADISNSRTENIYPRFNLLFHNGVSGASEKEVLNLKAFKGMTRTFKNASELNSRLSSTPPDRVYQSSYYNNLAAGVFSKGDGLICGLADMPGDVYLFIGLDMGGVHQRAPGSAFLFKRNGAQLGWQFSWSSQAGMDRSEG